MFEEKQLGILMRYGRIMKGNAQKDKALELLMDALDKRVLETQLSNGMKIIGDAVIKKTIAQPKEFYVKKITDYFTQKAKRRRIGAMLLSHM